MKIGELAHVAQCTVETVRYYEKEGLLPAPARTAANYRSYGSAHIDRLRFIRNCRALNMTHEEIRALLGFMDQPAGDCGAVNQLLDEHIAHVDVRIAELSQLKRQLSELRQRCRSEQSVDACGILHGLASMETEPRHERHTHIG
ncbi:MAG: Cd(II)/Pb(II)-responsive transcriptional regulator [Burkholderiales bacterium]|uniref:Cd(II)/Pb(II)-responsive transcriptional regulator n=1 Tax=Pandoraea sp. TaxID=1883445 RepID=UPI0011F97471|nr:Cd(II)/Pb(II)-responsive transcriptional regulator [Pandoraea sp.]MBU6491605.1 Cd(II)/Pb(II)-responsive transcriptional regulator [Burkholderiales bacterium]MDE2289461.1 Cd(II)/Pb(II)-responsive transcriptional regulator [Burkholderiales bacterium]MDE2609274.1 Cd(II)/Pb(II)-responsive transcriptional regulator [Burkholderiales bacterium]TAM15216.1 MAG: Cd(II)/Pb(II)-responsive transcriptional regulator [Pandoraea sp.]